MTIVGLAAAPTAFAGDNGWYALAGAGGVIGNNDQTTMDSALVAAGGTNVGRGVGSAAVTTAARQEPDDLLRCSEFLPRANFCRGWLSDNRLEVRPVLGTIAVSQRKPGTVESDPVQSS